ncbi:Protein spinster [Orchesella cincta]|uniref:Protein spinster n=1 Tax=Orchesella cincta TaxID=48709 RepID=A0A1D2NGI2_ORCCI|nr:Protein spinster [Orchesella cincta]
MANAPGMVSTASAQSPTGNGAVVIPEGEGVGRNRIPTNKSSQKLVNEDYLQPSSTRNSLGNGDGGGGDSIASSIDTTAGRRRSKISKMEWATVFILFYVNLINYMDRFTLAGVLDDVSKSFGINNGEQGLLQTVFVISYMVFAPMFGYMGDRYSRRVIMAFGVILWSVTTLAGSFMEGNFYWFIAFRAMVGIGEASYSTIAPTIISDLFLDDVRSKMLALFYFAIPVGGGLGYIVGAQAANLGGAWYWALRVTPFLGLIAVIFIIFIMVDPPRGEREGSTALKATTWGEDMKYLLKNKSFMLSTFGFTCVTFVTGALAWWGPKYIFYGLMLQNGGDQVKQTTVSFIFGVVTMMSGLIGVPLGALAATNLRTRFLKADPLICAFGLIVSTPLIFGGAILAKHNEALCFTLIFFGELFLNLNWAIVADILLYVVIPTRRSTAEAFQILLSHALGDAGSPYLIGKISDWIKPWLREGGPVSDEYVEFTSLQYALFVTVFVQIFGGILFLVTACYVVQDKRDCDGIIAASSGESITINPNPPPPPDEKANGESETNETGQGEGENEK